MHTTPITLQALRAQSPEGLLAVPVWHDPLVVAMPATHPLMTFRTGKPRALAFPISQGFER